jgi:2-methylaconitate cis-trans-isomerase PrpF
MFPRGIPQEILTVDSLSAGIFQVRVSLVDAANPFVFVDAYSISINGYSSWPNQDEPSFLSIVEDIRRAGAVQFGLAENLETAGQRRNIVA